MTERDPQADLAALQAIHDAAQRRDVARAGELARAALEGGLEHPLVLNVLALMLEQQQRLEEAAGLLQRAVQIAPRDGAVRNALGLLLLRLERPAEALDQFEALQALDPAASYGHAGRGAALQGLERYGEAVSSYLKAIQLDPRQGVALAGLAHIASRRGQHAEARRWALQALGVLPDFPDAVMSLAAAELGEGQAAHAQRRLQILLGRDLDVVDQAQACGLLGDALDQGGQVELAFKAYTKCNDLLREHYAPRYAGQTRAVDYARKLPEVLRRLPRAEWRAAPAPETDPQSAAGHVFVVGFPRSGTTLLELALEGSPQVISPGEHEFLLDAVREFMQQPTDLARLPLADDDTVRRLRASYWNRVTQTGTTVTSRIFVDKHPLNTLKLPLIARLFPDAKIIFMVRDPRDVVLSCYRRRFQMNAPMFELLTLQGATRYYDAVMRTAEACEACLPITMRRVRYEDLVSDFDAQLKSLCAFAGVPWSAAMREFGPRTALRSNATPSTAQLARGLDTQGIGVWRRYRTQLAAVEPILRPWIERFGYPAE